MTLKRTVLLAALALTAGAALGTSAVAGSGVEARGASSEPRVPIPFGKDMGAGERVLLVVGGAYASRAEAEAAAQRVGFGDVQGYFVASTSQFPGLETFLGDAAGEFVTVSAFRTGRGAQEFLALARAVGAPALLTPRLPNLGLEYVGLGQEAAPDGSGPLTEPIPGLTLP